MAESKKCPFNNFNPCIGNGCAFHIEPIRIKKSEKMKAAFGSSDELIIDPSDIGFPCSISIMGNVAFLSKQPTAKKVEK